MSAIQSFPRSTETGSSVATPKVQQPVVVSAADQIIALAQQLDTEQRKRILAEVFADDLKLLVKQETDKGHQLGLAKGTEQAAAQQVIVADRFNAELSAQKAQLAQLIENFEPKGLQLPADVTASMVSWQAEAVFRVLGHEVKDKQYLLENLAQVAAETALLQGVELHCHPQDVAFFKEPVKSHRHIQQVVANPAVRQGEIRIVCGNSQITTSLATRLQQLSAQLLDLAVQ